MTDKSKLEEFVAGIRKTMAAVQEELQFINPARNPAGHADRVRAIADYQAVVDAALSRM